MFQPKNQKVTSIIHRFTRIKQNMLKFVRPKLCNGPNTQNFKPLAYIKRLPRHDFTKILLQEKPLRKQTYLTEAMKEFLRRNFR